MSEDEMKNPERRSSQTRTIAERNLLVDQYRDFSERTVRLLMKRMSLPEEHHDEFRSAAYLGLIDAAERFDSASPHTFQTYAFHRIRGAVIDYIRRVCELRGKTYYVAKALSAAESVREACFSHYGSCDAHGADESPKGQREELAAILEFASQALLTRRLTMSDTSPQTVGIAEDGPSPEDLCSTTQEHLRLRQFVAELPVRERLIIEAYYFRDLSFVEAAEEIVGISKSWASRIHARAIKRLQKRFREEEARESTLPQRTTPQRQRKRSRQSRKR